MSNYIYQGYEQAGLSLRPPNMHNYPTIIAFQTQSSYKLDPQTLLVHSYVFLLLQFLETTLNMSSRYQ